MKLRRDGDLTLEFPLEGARVQCVRVPNIRHWEARMETQAFTWPKVGEFYHVRAVGCSIDPDLLQYYTGVLLREIRNAPHTLLGEPLFEFSCFNLFQGRR